MSEKNSNTLNPRKTFMKAGACSHAMYKLVNNAFGYPREEIGQAADPFAGGILQRGYQCGMLWGASLAVGTESFRRFGNSGKAVAIAISATHNLIQSFTKKSKSPNCSDITHTDFSNRFQFTLFMLNTLVRGFYYSPCFNLMAKWTPEAINTAELELIKEHDNFNYEPKSCATELLKKMGGSEEDMIIVAGLAGGLGLSGNACGALGACIWWKNLNRIKSEGYKKHMEYPDSESIIQSFLAETGFEFECSKICGRQFASIDEHSDYLNSGGCSKLIESLSNFEKN